MDEKVLKKIMTRARRITALEKEIDELRMQLGGVEDRVSVVQFGLHINHWSIPQLVKIFPQANVTVTQESVLDLYRIEVDVDGVSFIGFTIGEYAKEFMNE